MSQQIEEIITEGDADEVESEDELLELGSDARSVSSKSSRQSLKEGDLESESPLSGEDLAAFGESQKDFEAINLLTQKMLKVLNDNSKLQDGDVVLWTENHLKLLLSLARGLLNHLNLLEELMSFHPTQPISMAPVREILGLVTGDLKYVKSL